MPDSPSEVDDSADLQPPHPGRAVFIQGEHGLTRFPPNIEQILVEHQPLFTLISMRRNDVTLKFALRNADREHLAALLLARPPYE